MQIGTGVNQFFSMRYPSVTITSLVAQLVSYPVGCFFAKALPIMKIRLFNRWDLVINPDHHFNIKEHAVITIMSNLSFNQSWVSDYENGAKKAALTRVGECYHSSTKSLPQYADPNWLPDPARAVHATVWPWSGWTIISIYY